MLRFLNWLGKRNTLTEGIWGLWNYKVPEDKREQMYDFYMMEYLMGTSMVAFAATQMGHGPQDPKAARDEENRERKAQGRRPVMTLLDDPEDPEGLTGNEKESDTPSPAGDSSKTYQDKFNYALGEVVKKLVPTLKKELLDAVEFAVGAEMQHLFDVYDKSRYGTRSGDLKPGQDKYDPVIDLAQGRSVYPLDKHPEGVEPKYFGGYSNHGLPGSHDKHDQLDPDKAASMVRRYATNMEALKHNSSHGKMLRKSKRGKVSPTAKGSQSGYTNSWRAMKASGGTTAQWMKLAAWLFHNSKWESAYGGKAWAGIAESWTKLKNASSLKEEIYYIDHIYDLQHNTGSIFTKLKSFSKDGYAWIKTALDHKRLAQSPHEYLQFCSSPMRELAEIGIKLKTGRSLEDWSGDSKDKIGDFEKTFDLQTKAYNDNERTEYEKAKAKGDYKAKPTPLTPKGFAKHILDKYPNDKKYPQTYLGMVKSYLKKHPTGPDEVGGTSNTWRDPEALSAASSPYGSGAYGASDPGSILSPPGSSNDPFDPDAMVWDSKFDIGDKVKIHFGSSPYVHEIGTIVEKVKKHGNPYFKVKFKDGNTYDYNPLKFGGAPVEKAGKPAVKPKIGDKITVTVGSYKDMKGTITKVIRDSGIGSVYKISLEPSGLPLELSKDKFTIDDPAKAEAKIGDKVKITSGFYKDKTGKIDKKVGPFQYKIVLDNEAAILPKTYNADEFEVIEPGTQSEINVGDIVQVLELSSYKDKFGKVVSSALNNAQVKLVGKINPIVFDKNKLKVVSPTAVPMHILGMLNPPPFKVDDWAKVKSTGQYGIVISIGGINHDEVMIKSEDGKHYGFFASELEATPKPKTYFKLGGWAKITIGNGFGAVGKITHVGENFVDLEVEGDQTYTKNLSEIEPATEPVKDKFKAGDYVKISTGFKAGSYGTIVYKNGFNKYVVSINGANDSFDQTSLELADKSAIDTQKAIKQMKENYNAFNASNITTDYKLARSLLKISPTSLTPLELVKNLADSLKIQKTDVELQYIVGIFKKEAEAYLYFQKPSPIIPKPISKTIELVPHAALDLISKHYQGVPAIPPIDMDTIYKIEAELKKNFLIQAIKSLRTVLGWDLMAAKNYATYLTLELLSHGERIPGYVP